MVEEPQSIKNGSDVLGLQAHAAHQDGLRKPRTLVRERRREAAKKDAGSLAHLHIG